MATTVAKNEAPQPTNGVDKVKKCKRCEKDVFQMELIKAEKAFWHRNCFKCSECNKQLRMDTYQSHEGVLYCKPHFRSLFAPKPVEEVSEPSVQPRKYEVIVRENQPQELPPDVVRSSDKPNLGLEELQSLDLRSRYQMFEKPETPSTPREGPPPSRQAIKSKIARLGSKGVASGVPDEELKGMAGEDGSSSDEEPIGGNFTERLGYKEMRDIRRKFEDGHVASREERREERKQEIQNIRSRLFMGKQAKIKEMYQQAVLESEQGGNTGQVKDFGVCKEASSIRDRFERGEVFSQARQTSREDDVSEIVQHGLAKTSRSIFQELDANQGTAPPPVQTPRPASDLHRSPSMASAYPPSGEIVRSDSQVDNVHVETKEISSRFKFFETYRPKEVQKREFRITPPREGVVRMPSPEKPEYADWPKASELIEEEIVSKKTASKMLSIFRQMEMMDEDAPADPKAPKEITPPPEISTNGHNTSGKISEAERIARARELKSKFENWDFENVERSSSSVRLFDGEDESQIESTKSLSAKFESMKDTSRVFRPRANIKVNRFV
ncbi:protein-methionine sulfoxide oxidase mical3b [Lutzomyia longipalpis]|uniref:Putative lim domain and actin-binding protein 1 n=1 Tax=Lutzomyia longipalpis TaxID=7200 RepID=A0A7G3ANA5_LUTLO|nr:protein-methionine sulfoxide oxidase mical3b [Lutzomyia longipalpis]